MQIDLEPPTDAPTVANLLDSFLGDKYEARKAGEISEVTYSEYETTCDVINEWGGRRRLASINFADWRELRRKRGQGRTKQLGPMTVKRRLTIARMAFKWASKLDVPIDYADALSSPAAKLLRKARNDMRANGYS